MAEGQRSPVAVVTGASRGIGAAVARALGRTGAHIVAVARTVGGLEELDDAIRAGGGTATLVPLDLGDLDAMDRLGAAIYERHGKLDMLFGAGAMLGPLSPLGHIDQKQWDRVVQVNLTANWRLIRSLDPLLRAAPAGRAAFVSSGAAAACRAYWGPYAVTKAALEALVRTYAEETRTTNVRANLIDPGPVRTRMRAEAMPGEDPASLPTPEDLATEIVKLLDPAFTESGRIYNFPSRSLQSFRRPG